LTKKDAYNGHGGAVFWMIVFGSIIVLLQLRYNSELFLNFLLAEDSG